MLNGLDLFSGIGGLSLALEPFVRPIAYCENDRYAQGVLLSRMGSGAIQLAPIWDDVRTLPWSELPRVDLISGGFPCQDLSVAGHGAGLGGERSGLFFEIVRLTKELRPAFVFLENVPAIRTRGLNTVAQSFADLGYDLRWTVVSAAEVGAPHLRKRWFMLAHAKRLKLRQQPGRSSGEDREGKAITRNNGEAEIVANTLRSGPLSTAQQKTNCGDEESRTRNVLSNGYSRSSMADPARIGRRERRTQSEPPRNPISGEQSGALGLASSQGLQGSKHTQEAWKALRELGHSGSRTWPSGVPQPSLCRGDDGLLYRMERLKCLGNSVVPLQARTAFQRLMGIC